MMGLFSTQGYGPWLLHVLRDAAWAPLAVFIVHLIGDKGLDAYNRFPHFDVPMHLLGGMAIAYWFHVGSLRGSAYGVLGAFQRLTHCLLVFGLTCAAAVLWEFAEFLADRYLGTRMQNGDLADTLLDLLMGLVGGLGWLALSWSRLPLSEKTGGNSDEERLT